MSKIVSGVYAAVSTPRRRNGSLDELSLQKTLEFLLAKGIRGFALNGATGEYCLTAGGELKRILQASKEVINNAAEFVVGIGSAGMHGCLENGKLAVESGATGILLPMPHFFPYSQDDLAAFCTAVAEQLPLPILVYNLPQFTSGLDSDTVQILIKQCTNIVGIKDSSGSLEILRDLTNNKIESCRILGNDSALADALRENVADGVISGVAGVLPELILSLYELRNQTYSAEFQETVNILDEFIRQLDVFPTPWGLKIIGESRGIAPVSFSQPLSPQRLEQIRAIKIWFKEWQSALLKPRPLYEKAANLVLQ